MSTSPKRLAVLASAAMALRRSDRARPARPGAASTGLVISEVYGAGGNAGAAYNADYVELSTRPRSRSTSKASTSTTAPPPALAAAPVALSAPCRPTALPHPDEQHRRRRCRAAFARHSLAGVSMAAAGGRCSCSTAAPITQAATWPASRGSSTWSARPARTSFETAAGRRRDRDPVLTAPRRRRRQQQRRVRLAARRPREHRRCGAARPPAPSARSRATVFDSPHAGTDVTDHGRRDRGLRSGGLTASTCRPRAPAARRPRPLTTPTASSSTSTPAPSRSRSATSSRSPALVPRGRRRDPDRGADGADVTDLVATVPRRPTTAWPDTPARRSTSRARSTRPTATSRSPTTSRPTPTAS